MNEKPNRNEPVAGYREVRVQHTLRNEVEPVLARLDSAVTMLPKVDANGYSECPYAAQIYRQKDEAASKVSDVLERVRNILRTVEREVTRCQKRLEYLQSQEDEIHDPRVRDGYGTAALEVQRDLALASNDRRLLRDAIARMERALKHAAKLTYPGSNQQPGYEGRPQERMASSAVPQKPNIPPAAHGIISLDARR